MFDINNERNQKQCLAGKEFELVTAKGAGATKLKELLSERRESQSDGAGRMQCWQEGTWPPERDFHCREAHFAHCVNLRLAQWWIHWEGFGNAECHCTAFPQDGSYLGFFCNTGREVCN